MSLILVTPGFTLTSCSDSHFKRPNVVFQESKPDGVALSSNNFGYGIRKNKGKTLWVLADRKGAVETSKHCIFSSHWLFHLHDHWLLDTRLGYVQWPCKSDFAT